MKYVIKASGEQEPFSEQKFRRSLEKAKADPATITRLIDLIKQREDLKTTADIYRFALNELKKEERPIAARYNLKKALFELGPSGFPFELYVAKLLEEHKYQVSVGSTLQGFCVSHEIDILAHKENKHYMIECKFHIRQGIKTTVKITLYVQARFEDLKKQWHKDPKHTQELHKAWLVTNTKLTTDAIAYGNCVDMQLLSWSYPAKESLAQLIDQTGMYPITCLTTLSLRQKKELMAQGFVLCRDVHHYEQQLKKLGLSDLRIQKIMHESETVCKL